MLALRGKKINFDKVLTMIDDMVALLKQEQLDDDHKKEYCIGQFDLADDKKKALECVLRASSYHPSLMLRRPLPRPVM